MGKLYKTLIDGKITMHEKLRDAVIQAYNSESGSVLIMDHEEYRGVRGQLLSTERVLYTLNRKYEYMPNKVWGVYENFIEHAPEKLNKRYVEVTNVMQLLTFVRLYSPVYYLFEAKNFEDVIVPGLTIWENPLEYPFYYRTMYRPDAIMNAAIHDNTQSKKSTVILIEMFIDVDETESVILPYCTIDYGVNSMRWTFRDEYDYSFLKHFREEELIEDLRVLNSIAYSADIYNVAL
jgi:hypothetical protein